MYGIGYSLFNTATFLNSRGGVALDPDAQAFITAASITDPTQISAVNTLVTDLKTASIWNKMKAVYPFVGGTAASHKFNLVNPVDSDVAFRLSFAGGWTHSANGAKANGSNATALTHFVHSVQLPDFKISVSTSRDSCTTGMIFGANSIRHYEWVDVALAFGTTVGQGYGFQLLNGYSIMTRTSNTAYNYHANGTKNVITSTTNGAATTEFELASFLSIYSNARYKFFHIGEDLSDVESLNLYNAVLAFNTTLGR